MKVFFIVKINKMLKSSKKDNVYSAKVKALQGGHVKVAPRTVN